MNETTSSPPSDFSEPAGLNPYPYDPDKARQLLSEANWDGSQHKITSHFIPGNPVDENLFSVRTSVVGDEERVAWVPGVIGNECAVRRPCHVDGVAIQEDLWGSADQWHQAQPSIRISAGEPNLRAVVRDADVSHD